MTDQALENELKLIKLEKTLTMIADEIKIANLGAIFVGNESINIPRHHWVMIKAMGEDAARLVRGEL